MNVRTLHNRTGRVSIFLRRSERKWKKRSAVYSLPFRLRTASAEEERNEESLFSIPAAFLLLFSPPARLTGRGRGGPGEGGRGGGKLINKEKKARRKFPVYGARSPREEEERMKTRTD